jgi:MFS family permease
MVLDIVSDPAERPKYLSLCGAAVGVGFMVGPVIGGVAAALFSAKGAWFSAAIFAGIGGIIATVSMRESHPVHSTRVKVVAAGLKGAEDVSHKKLEPPPGGLGVVVHMAAINMFLTQCEQ